MLRWMVTPWQHIADPQARVHGADRSRSLPSVLLPATSHPKRLADTEVFA